MWQRPKSLPLETEYPHLSVVHLFKEPLHQQRRGAHYTEIKNPVKHREKIYFSISQNLRPERYNQPALLLPPRYRAPDISALQQESAHYKELSEPVKGIKRKNLIRALVALRDFRRWKES